MHTCKMVFQHIHDQQSDSDPKEGEVIALCCPQYIERPQIAKVLKINTDGTLHVEWYDGKWSGKWKTYTYYQGRRKVAWEEDVHKKFVTMRGVNFSSSGWLSANTKAQLKQLYDNIDK